jgi:uncharacterized protein YndB with AHSA1/START domain
MIAASPFLVEANSIFPARSRHELLDVHTSVLIEAEYRRILYALTMPEYMEAWLRIPGAEKTECSVEPRSIHNFRICFNTASRPSQTIYGSCFFSRPNTITYLWDRTRMGSIAKSIVKMQLRGGAKMCALQLSHSGACAKNQHDSYRVMWSDSLNALRNLMESTHTKQRPKIPERRLMNMDN